MRTFRSMPALLACGLLSVATAFSLPSPALACGDVETGGSCGGATGDADEARWMLNRVVAAIETDETKALDLFTRGGGGFRMQDRYVFCIGPDGRMSAHPDPKLMGVDARALRDPNGKAFAAQMLDQAKEGQVAEVSYLYPRPGSDRPVKKTSFVTRVNDQVCGVGYYDADVASDSADAAMPLAERVAQLRQRLGLEMPDTLRANWTAFLDALDAERQAEAAAVAKARVDVDAAASALSAGGAAPLARR